MKGWVGWKRAAFLQFRWKANISGKIITPATRQKAKGNFRFRYGGKGLMDRSIPSDEEQGIYSLGGGLHNFRTHFIRKPCGAERKLVGTLGEPMHDFS
jgi:hypothetical protein